MDKLEFNFHIKKMYVEFHENELSITSSSNNTSIESKKTVSVKKNTINV